MGDVLEYEVRSEQKTPEIPGQFWYSQPLETTAVILDQTLTISVPSGKYVKVSSPSLKPTETENAGRRTYLWKRSQLVPTSENAEFFVLLNGTHADGAEFISCSLKSAVPRH